MEEDKIEEAKETAEEIASIENFAIIDKNNKTSQSSQRRSLKTTQKHINSNFSIEDVDNAREIEDRKKVEAALFIAGRFLELKELVALTDVNPILLRKILGDLDDNYKDSAISIVKRDNMWKMDVASEYSWIVNKLATGSSEFTKAEQETLAVIAHKQPIKQSFIVKIRGNKAYDHIKNFVERGLLNKKKMGHTAELSLSDDFYDYFHVGKDNNAAAFEKKQGE